MNTPKYYNQFDISKIAEDPKNKVYTYVHDNPTAIFPVDQQKKYIQDIRLIYLKYRELNPEWSDVEIKNKIKEEHPNYNLFIQNNKRIFDVCTSRNSTEEHINHIKYMLYLREQKEHGFIDEVKSQQMIQDYLVAKFKTNMSLDEYKALMAKEKAEKAKLKAQKKKSTSGTSTATSTSSNISSNTSSNTS